MVNKIGSTGAQAPLEGPGDRKPPTADVGGKAANLILLKGALTAAKPPPLFFTCSVVSLSLTPAPPSRPPW